jgi:hypothetical protein
MALSGLACPIVESPSQKSKGVFDERVSFFRYYRAESLGPCCYLGELKVI